MDLETAERMEKYLINALTKFCVTTHCIAVGETRRQISHPKSLEMLCLIDTAQGHPPLEFGKPAFASYFDQTLAGIIKSGVLVPANKGTSQRKFTLPQVGANLIMYCLTDLSLWGVQAVVRTGPLELAKWCVTEKQYGGGLPDRHRIDDGWKIFDPQGNVIPMPSEGEFFEFLGLSWIIPANREHFKRYIGKRP